MTIGYATFPRSAREAKRAIQAKIDEHTASLISTHFDAHVARSFGGFFDGPVLTTARRDDGAVVVGEVLEP